MIELELLGVGSDGQSLVLTDADGQRYAVPITDELRGAVRRDRPRLEAVAESGARTLRPRDIQTLLRSGLSAEDIAQEYGADVAHVRRFEAPVAAEKDWALTRARESHVGGDREAPVMEDLVVDRLAARGVDPESLVWTASRPADGAWEICLTFVQGAAEHAAHWVLSPGETAVDAVDQEARWLTETVAPAPVPSVFTPLPLTPTAVGAEEARAREALLDQLDAVRGRRQDIDIDLEGPDADGTDLGPLPGEDASAAGDEDGPRRDTISARIYSLAHARARTAHAADGPGATAGPAGPDGPGTAAGDRTGAAPSADGGRAGATPAPPATSTTPAATAADPVVAPSGDGDRDGAPAGEGTGTGGPKTADTPLPGMEQVETPTPVPGHTERKRSRRRSVPSWDEIVFGSRNQ